MLDDSADPDLADADTVHEGYLKTCAMIGVEPVPRERAHELVAEWSDSYCACFCVATSPGARGDRRFAAMQSAARLHEQIVCLFVSLRARNDHAGGGCGTTSPHFFAR